MVQTTVGTSEPGKSVLDTEATSESGVLGCDGTGLGAVGPAGSYADYSVLSKLLLSMAMLMGRLEIYPMLVALSPSVWRKD